MGAILPHLLVFSKLYLLLSLSSLFLCFPSNNAHSSNQLSNRQTLGIGIGGSGSSPPSVPEPQSPKPPPPPKQKPPKPPLPPPPPPPKQKPPKPPLPSPPPPPKQKPQKPPLPSPPPPPKQKPPKPPLPSPPPPPKQKPPKSPLPPPPPPPKQKPPQQPLPPPKKPPQPQSPPQRGLTSANFPNLLLYQSYKVIQRFKKTIFCDPKGVIKTWVGADLAKYRGFFLEATPRFKNSTIAIASVDFNGFHLCAPTISGFIDGFPDLALLHANSNNFSGGIPDLTHLPYLYELDISNNRFSGNFPGNVLPLLNLTFLDLRFNHFAGFVPPAAFGIPLEVLFLNNNHFSRPLPANLGQTTANYLTLANNGFTGPIPASIALANRTLIEVLLLGNKLSGCLPPGIGRLHRATVFDAGFNEITGPIPKSLGCLRRAEQLNFAGNLLYGKVPEEVCNLGISGSNRIFNLSLSENFFTSLGNSCRILLRRGVLDVRRNCIPGFPNQRSPAECRLFLANRKHCPLVSNSFPCYKSMNDDDGGASLPAAGDAPARKSGYASYSAFGKRIGL